MTWLQSYISNRKQFVQLGNLKSKSLNKQGKNRDQSWDPNYSFYTPMIFGKCLIFYKQVVFADDTHILYSGEDLQQLLLEVKSELKKK